jgi:hypothetical protein
MVKTNKFKQWFPIFIFIVIAIGFRIYRTSTDNYYLLAGSDGPYLPVQVKSLFQHFRLAFNDMPLLFVMCAIVAKVLFLLKLGSENECIFMAIKFVDSILPPLAVIPVFKIAQELWSEKIKNKFLIYFIAAFSILSFTPLFIFSFQLQKNAFAVIFLFFYIYYVIKLLKYQQRNDALKASLILFICAITHLGCFGILVFISLSVLIVWCIVNKQKLNKQSFKIVVAALLLIVFMFSLIAMFDFSRFNRIAQVPLKIFEAPALLFAIKGQNILLVGQTLIILLANILLAIVGLIYIIVSRKRFELYKVVIGCSMGFAALFLSNPMLGLEWASRLFMMTYIPITILYLIIYSISSNNWINIPTVFIFVLLLMLSIGTTTFDKPILAMDNASFNELNEIKNKKIFVSNDAIVARQSLRILSNWVFETKGIDKYLLTKTAFNNYAHVYLLKQIKGKNPLLRESEPSLGDSVLPVFKGEYFELYKLINNTQLPTKAEKIFKGIKGTVQYVDANKIVVIHSKTNKPRTIIYDAANKVFPTISNGMKVEINGEWIPFSISIKAETIKVIKDFNE